MIALAILSVGLVGCIWILQEYRKFEEDARNLRISYIAGQKALVKEEVDRVIDYIEYQRTTTEDVLKEQIRERVYLACGLAEEIYNRYHDSRSQAEIKEMIRELLRSIRFDDGRGYYFIYDMQGNNVLLPFSPQLEGSNLWDMRDNKGLYTIRRMVALMREKGEGFLHWYWYKPGEPDNMVEKIGFSKLFAPYDWWIGTGEYIEDFEKEVQRQTLARINTIRFGDDGYIFVYDFEANTLAHYKPENLGINQWHFRDPNGIAVVQELIQLSQEEQGGFLEYVATIRPVTGEPAAKITYVRSIDTWRWTVGTGVYIDGINVILAEKRADLSRQIIRSAVVIISSLLFCFLFIVCLSRYVSGKISNNIREFTDFFEHAATDASVIDDRVIHFVEFKSLAWAANQMIEERNEATTAVAQLQQQLNRSRKMEALGVLAGGVAHDLNNVLSAIVGYPDLILAGLPIDSPQRKYIEAMRDSGLKASEIIQDLLTLARRGVNQQAVIDLNALVEGYLVSPEYLNLRSNHPNVAVEVLLASDLLGIKGSQVHLQKTVMNLVVNAAEAQPKGGIIRIRTENRYVDKPLRGYEQITEGDYVILAVEDEGVGIAEADLELIFEPFFSRKTLGRSGTGLGMAVVWGTVQDHNGFINVTTAEGQGTIFELYFPATRENVADECLPVVLEECLGSNQTILVIDDIAEQRDLAKTMLDRLGYRTETAISGEEALQRLAREQYDLLILDMIMTPGIDGLETLQKALVINPNQRAIIVSGYAETDRVQMAMELGAKKYVKKPYTIRMLAVAVKKTLWLPQNVA